MPISYWTPSTLEAVVRTDDLRPSWPAAVVCRVVPALLLAAGTSVPAAEWASLPRHRPGLLLLGFAGEVAGLLIVLPQVWKPRTWVPEPWTGPSYFIGVIGILLGWLRSKFGPTAAGLFLLASGAGLAVATSVASSHRTAWHLPAGAVVCSLLGAALIAVPSGSLVRRFGLFVDRDGRYVPRPGS
jgi:hypothetical protein